MSQISPQYVDGLELRIKEQSARIAELETRLELTADRDRLQRENAALVALLREVRCYVHFGEAWDGTEADEARLLARLETAISPAEPQEPEPEDESS